LHAQRFKAAKQKSLAAIKTKHKYTTKTKGEKDIQVDNASNCAAHARMFNVATGILEPFGTKLTCRLSMNKLIWHVANTSPSDTVVMLGPEALKNEI
jgi:hypothetical protein